MQVIPFVNIEFSRLARRYTVFFYMGFATWFCPLAVAVDNAVSNEWVSLFNGKDLSGWTVKFAGYELDHNYKNTFQAVEGVLRVSYENYDKFDGEFGHIFYHKLFSHYIIRLEYRFIGDQVAGGPAWALRNNGIMLHSQSPATMSTDQQFPVSIEAQILGGNGIDSRPTANVCTPGTHIVMNAEVITQHCINSTSATFHGDQWVRMEVEVHGSSKIIHRINDEVVFEYQKPQFDAGDTDAKLLISHGQSLMLGEGYISLQAESHPTEFRNIEILQLQVD